LKSLTVKKIRWLEEKAKRLGMAERMLIENASSSMFTIIDSLGLGKKVLIVAGRGNNGADVLSCARKMLSKGYYVKVAILTEKTLGEEVLFQKNILEKVKAPLYTITQGNSYVLDKLIDDRDFIVEGILGIGVKGEVSPFLQEIISIINAKGKKIVSCDIPSGLSPERGVVLGKAIKADYTITFIALKKGFFLNQGRKFTGRIFLADIGISSELLERAVSSKRGER
jgi:NAD(P)H-hydrate epimerase